MAEAIVNARVGDRWRAFSAGTHPASAVHPLALDALSEIGIDAVEAKPKPLELFRGEAFDLVVTVCDQAAEECPVWLGFGKRVHLGLPDPARETGAGQDVMAAFRSVRDEIVQRVLPLLRDFADGRHGNAG
jgi:arsenate reductase (thioredoxin)